MTGRAKTIAAALALAGAFTAGWTAQGWRADAALTQARQAHAGVLAEIAAKAQAVAEAVKQAGIEANNAISAADARAWKGLEDDRKELGRLRGCVAAGTCGVRLITKYVPADSGARDSSPSSVGHDTIEITPDVQRRVLDLRESIAEDQRKIEYLQEYSLSCWYASKQ